MTLTLFSVLASSCLSALFDVHPIPLPGPNGKVFLAGTSGKAAAAVFVLDGSTLSVYSPATQYASVNIAFEPGTTAFDIADLDGDGKNEVIGIAGNRVLHYVIPLGETPAPPRELFTRETRYSASSVLPYPQVLVVNRDGRALLALPCGDSVEYRDRNGTLISEQPLERSMHATMRQYRLLQCERAQCRAFSLVLLERTEILSDQPRAIPTRVLQPPLPEQIGSPEAGTLSGYGAFSLKTDGSGLLRAYWTRRYEGRPVTVVRIREAKSEKDNLLDRNTQMGPERTYRGNGIYCNTLPDFNHDGFTDLALWKAPMPGISVDAMTRAITGSVWPVDIALHLFSPKTKRFGPTPWGQLSVTVPVTWFLSKGPIRNEVFRDFNGDGGTDIACSTSEGTFCAWTPGENGIGKKADFEFRFPEPILSVEFVQDLDGNGRTSIGLRGEKNLYLLRASS